MFKYMLIGGRFDDTNPKKSGYIAKLFDALMAVNNQGTLINGGKYDDLINLLQASLTENIFDNQVILWMPDVSNDKEKLVGSIKKIHPTCVLVTSKNNFENKYSIMQIIAHALNIKSNLFMELTRQNPEQPHKIYAQIWDPLGNIFCDSDDIERIAVTLMTRVNELLKFTRVKSTPIKEEITLTPVVNSYFFELVKGHAETFHNLIHAPNSERFLGNASFRCGHGFPSFRDGDWVYVSKRNIDKRDIGLESFVPVRLNSNNEVEYLGKNKPSVDTPIQLMLYKYYKNIRYMIHSHVYIELPISGFETTTDKLIPCGALEEFYEIIKIFPNRDIKNKCVNLNGHGSLVMASDLSYLENIPYYARRIK